MTSLLLIVALPVAVVAAIRGVWSPCGLSMLSSITPMTEAGRDNRFRTTAAWFVVGGVIGGVTLGAVAAGGAALIAATGATLTTRLVIGALIAVATAAVDLGVFGIELPIFKRQVNDAWLRTYRGWVYGAGFGWQIGVGVATYIMTAGILLMVALAVLTASPLAALAIGTTFGLVRGSAVFIGRSATTPTKLAEVHARLDHYGPASRSAALWVQMTAAVMLSIAWLPVFGFALVIAGVALALEARRGRAEPDLGAATLPGHG